MIYRHLFCHFSLKKCFFMQNLGHAANQMDLESHLRQEINFEFNFEMTTDGLQTIYSTLLLLKLVNCSSP